MFELVFEITSLGMCVFLRLFLPSAPPLIASLAARLRYSLVRSLPRSSLIASLAARLRYSLVRSLPRSSLRHFVPPRFTPPLLRRSYLTAVMPRSSILSFYWSALIILTYYRLGFYR